MEKLLPCFHWMHRSLGALGYHASMMPATHPWGWTNPNWLLAGGGTLYFAFPLLYASGFSGFYLPLMMVLWLLILRGVGIELRTHVDSPVWRGLFDGCFGIGSLLLAIFFGAAIGNVIRGVPLTAPAISFFRSGPTGTLAHNLACSIGTR